MPGKAINVTYSLPAELVDKYRDFAHAGYIPSISAAVREAMEEYAVKLQQKIVKREMETAARDPLFIEDMEQVAADFAEIDSDDWEQSQ
ncbi:MAG: hypothetical protein PHS56_07665 [Eubacteriales bacterium]|nr:hypothetical protein [Eubacteriales bacterium]